MAVLPHFIDVLPSHGRLAQIEFAIDVPEDAARIIPVSSGEGLELPVSQLTKEGLLEALEALGAKGSAGEVTKVVVDGTLFIAVGLGDNDGSHSTDTAVRRAMGAAARALKGTERAVVSADFGVRPVVEGLLLGGYAYDGLKKNEEKDESSLITVVGKEDNHAEFDAAVSICHAVTLARDLVNTPSNLLYPSNYAELARTVGEASGLTVEVLDEKELEAKGFGGITAVGQGSENPPRFVHLTWAPESATTSVALVGKGITFDTGGISLKPASGMEQMVMDMGGSAAVLAATCAAAALNIPVRIDAWMAMAENMPSGSAQRPGDVITHYGGITSEVINTDAEGRLVLADAIARASEYNPDYLIETSTLTGAQMVALGKRTFGVMGSDDLRDAIAETARELDEPGWAMPMLEEHDEEIKSAVADIKNTNADRFGGMEFAATYLAKFVGEGIQWAHIDVASPAWNTGGAHGYTPSRATGVPVRTIVDTLTQLAEN